MRLTTQRCVWIGAVIVVAAGLRFSMLALRPMHTDEAVHAYKFGQLLEGTYQYDAFDYHGPILNYLTRVVAYVFSQGSYLETNETTLRLVPAICGLLTVCLPLLLVRWLGWHTTRWAMLFTAISPGLTYYSRYYIQESLLVCFSFILVIGVWYYRDHPSLLRAICIGVAVGLMASTKETCVIVFFSVACAAICLRGTVSSHTKRHMSVTQHVGFGVAGLMSAFLILIVFYTSFFQHPSGLMETIRAIPVYFHRAGHSVHIHPWYFYLDLLTWIEFIEWPIWNEDFTVVLALIVAIFVWIYPDHHASRTHLVKFIVVYTITLMAIYCVIPYKTPWCMLGFLHGLVLLSALATSVLIESTKGSWDKVLTWGLIGIFGVASPLVQSYLLNFKYDADPSNPYVYAHTSRDIEKINQAVRSVARAHEQGRKMYIQVICPEDDYWPLPWTLRDFTKIGYKSSMYNPPAELIITQPSLVDSVAQYLYDIPMNGERHLYVPLWEAGTQLRPGVELLAYVRKDLWDKLESTNDY